MPQREASVGFRVFAIAIFCLFIAVAVSLRYDPEKVRKLSALFVCFVIVVLIGAFVEFYRRAR